MMNLCRKLVSAFECLLYDKLLKEIILIHTKTYKYRAFIREYGRFFCLPLGLRRIGERSCYMESKSAWQAAPTVREMAIWCRQKTNVKQLDLPMQIWFAVGVASQILLEWWQKLLSKMVPTSFCKQLPSACFKTFFTDEKWQNNL